MDRLTSSQIAKISKNRQRMQDGEEQDRRESEIQRAQALAKAEGITYSQALRVLFKGADLNEFK